MAKIGYSIQGLVAKVKDTVANLASFIGLELCYAYIEWCVYALHTSGKIELQMVGHGRPFKNFSLGTLSECRHQQGNTITSV